MISSFLPILDITLKFFMLFMILNFGQHQYMQLGFFFLFFGLVRKFSLGFFIKVLCLKLA